MTKSKVVQLKQDLLNISQEDRHWLVNHQLTGKFFNEVFASFSRLRFLLSSSSLLCVECFDPLMLFDLPKGMFRVRDRGPKMFSTQERLHRENTAVFRRLESFSWF